MAPVVHIGYHRSGSTFLQRSVFDPHPAIRNVPRRTVQHHFLRPGGMDFDQHRCRAWLTEEVRHATDHDQQLVLSDEELSGNIHTGGGGGYVTKEVAHRLRGAAPEATILIIIRNQLDMIESIYRQYVKRGGTLRLRGYLVDRGENHRLPGFRFRHLEYHRLIQLYVSLFGDQHVRVLPYERLQAEPAGFLGDLAESLDLPTLSAESSQPANPGFSPASLMLARASNRLYGRDRVNRRVLTHVPGSYESFQGLYRALDRVPAARSLPGWGMSLRDRDRSQAADRYRDGNQWVQKFTGIPLDQLGYPT